MKKLVLLTALVSAILLPALSKAQALDPNNYVGVNYDIENDRFWPAAADNYVTNNEVIKFLLEFACGGEIDPEHLTNVVFRTGSTMSGPLTVSNILAIAEELMQGEGSIASGESSVALGTLAEAANDNSFVWNGDASRPSNDTYLDNGEGTFNVNPIGGVSGFYIGSTNLREHISQIASMYGGTAVEQLAHVLDEEDPTTVDFDNSNVQYYSYMDALLSDNTSVISVTNSASENYARLVLYLEEWPSRHCYYDLEITNIQQLPETKPWMHCEVDSIYEFELVSVPGMESWVCKRVTGYPITGERINWLYEENGDGTVTLTGVALGTVLTGDLVIPSTIAGMPVTQIGEQAFSTFRDITSLTVPEGVTKIGAMAFQGCTSLQSVALPGSLTDIGNSAFSSDDQLANAVLGSGVTNIGDYAFYKCPITDVDIGDSVRHIGANAFYECALSDLVIGSGVETIDNFAFGGSRQLTNVEIPASVTSIGPGAFNACDALLACNVDENNSAYQSIDGVIYSKDGKTLIYYPAGRTGTYDIVQGTEIIGYYAFGECYKLTGITFPDSVTEIGMSAFRFTGLEHVTIPDSVRTLGAESFYMCSNLLWVVIGDNVETVERASFYCYPAGRLKIISCPGSWEAEGAGTYISSAMGPPSTVEYVYRSSNYDGPLNYSIDENGVTIISATCEDIPSHFVLPETINGYPVTTLAGDGWHGVFDGCNNLESIDLSSPYLSWIRNESLWWCENLSEITIGPNVVNIEPLGFCGPSDMSFTVDADNPVYMAVNGALVTKDGTTLVHGRNTATGTVPEGVTTLGKFSFGNCVNMTSMTVPEGVTNIAEGTFAGCPNLETLVLPDSLEEFSDLEMFTESNPKQITIPQLICARTLQYTLPQIYQVVTNVCIKPGVTTIGSRAFDECTALQGVSIPDSVTSIDAYAFRACSNLKTLTIPSSVESVGQAAFTGSGLTTLYVPASWEGTDNLADTDVPSRCSVIYGSAAPARFLYSESGEDEAIITGVEDTSIEGQLVVPRTINNRRVKRIADSAFEDCTGITSVSVPDTVTSIGPETFHNCTNLVDVVLPDGVTDIEDSAFSGCHSLRSIVIPDTVTNIGPSAFSSCHNLEHINIPESVTEINDWTFVRCYSLTNIDLHDGITSIGNRAFEECSGLTQVAIPGNITQIASRTFADCSGLTSITLPPGLTQIGTQAFQGCSSLESITIPESVSSIESHAFMNCSSLTGINIPEAVTEIGAYTFNGCRSLANIDIPETVTHIDELAFANCSGLGSFIIPPGETKIESDLFAGCTSLTNVVLHENVTSIGPRAFLNCSSLDNIELPAGVTEIWHEAFSGCSGLTAIDLPENIAVFGDEVFFNCSSLENLIMPHLQGPGENTFKGCTSLETLSVPYIWRDSGALTYDDVEPGCLIIYRKPDSLLYSINNLNEVSVWISAYGNGHGPDTVGEFAVPDMIDGWPVTKIGNVAFADCDQITSIFIPDTVKTIGNNAFNGCSSLETISMPNSWASGTNTQDVLDFSYYGIPAGCTVVCRPPAQQVPLEYEITSNNTVTILGFATPSIARSIFGRVVVPATIEDMPVTELGESAFAYCENITSLVIPSSVTNIESGAFMSMCNMVSIELSRNTRTIGAQAFASCSKMTTLIIPEGAANIGAYAFDGMTNLTRLVIPDSAVELGFSAFHNCPNLAKISAPGNWKECGMFENTALPEDCVVEYREPLTHWQYTESAGCVTITGVTGAEDDEWVFVPHIIDGSPVVGIGDGVFSNYTSLKHVVLPPGLSSIGASAFEQCTALADVHRSEPASLMSVYQAYSWSAGTALPTNLVYIGERAFAGCSNLPSIIEIPDSTETLGSQAFEGCAGIEVLLAPGAWDGADTVANSGLHESCIVVYRTLHAELVYSQSQSSGQILIQGLGDVTGSGVLFIPNTIKGIPVSTVGGFAHCTNITGVIIQDGVSSILSSAFEGCSNMVYAAIPNSVTFIGMSAFDNCTSLTELVFPDDANLLGMYVNGCANLQTMSVNGIWRWKKSDIERYLPETCTVIYRGLDLDWDFSPQYDENDNITHIVLMGLDGPPAEGGVLQIPGTLCGYPVTAMRDYGIFANRDDITSVVLPNENLTGLACGAFTNCVNLTNITFGASITNIGASALQGCSGLRDVAVPGNVVYVSDSAFQGCTGLTNVVMEEGVGFIESGAFMNCSGLIKAVVPDSVHERIYSDAFSGCENLQTLSVPGIWRHLPYYLSVAGVPETCNIQYRGMELDWQYYLLSGNNVMITGLNESAPDGLLNIPAEFSGYPVKSIMSGGAFSNRSDITKVVIPATIKEISEEAFAGCVNLTNIVFGHGSEEIGARAFAGCTGLKNVETPTNIIYIDEEAFSGCTGITNLVFSDNLGSIKTAAFKDCTGLREITFPDSLVVVRSNLFSGCENMQTLSVPGFWDSMSANYPVAEFGLPETCTVVYRGLDPTFSYLVLYNNEGYIDAVCLRGAINPVPNGVLEVPSVLVEKPVRYISGNAFEDRTDITSVIIPNDNVGSIEASAFAGCSNLEDVTIGAAVTNIGNYAFANCTGLGSITIPGNVLDVRTGAFSGCSNLSNVTLEEGVQMIMSSAFADCTSLTEISIPDSVETTLSGIFTGCTNLQTVSVPASWEGTGHIHNLSVPEGCTVVYRGQ